MWSKKRKQKIRGIRVKKCMNKRRSNLDRKRRKGEKRKRERRNGKREGKY